MSSPETNERFFTTRQVRDDLKRRSVRAFSFVLTSSAAEFVLRIASTAVLARLIAPEYFGLFMMTTAVTAIADQFRDLGLSTATIQREHIGHKEVSNLFWINTLAGLAIMVVVIFLAPVVSAYYHEPRMTAVTMALSINFLLGGLVVQHEALLTRQLKHGQKAAYRLAAFIISVVVAVILAVADFGYWALVWREIIRSALIVVGAIVVCPWVPGWFDRKTDVRQLIGFGANLSASYVVGIIASSMDRLLIGRFFGPDLVALYRQPYQLVAAPVSQFMGPLYQVTMPSLSMLQSERDRYRRFYHRVATLVGLASMPLSVYLAVYANEITQVVLGDKWAGAAVFMRIFAIGGIIRAVNSIPGFVMVSRGRSGLLLKMTALHSVAMIVLMSLATMWGPQAVAVAEVTTLPLMFVPWMFYSFKGSPISIASFLGALTRPALCALAVAGCLFAFRNMLPIASPLPSLMIGAVVAAAAVAVSWLGLPGGRSEIMAMSSDFISALRRKQHSEPTS